MRISDWSSDVCSSDLLADPAPAIQVGVVGALAAPAQALGDLGQGGDLGRVGAAFEAVGEDAVSAHARCPLEDARGAGAPREAHHARRAVGNARDASIRAMPPESPMPSAPPDIRVEPLPYEARREKRELADRKSTRLNSSH